MIYTSTPTTITLGLTAMLALGAAGCAGRNPTASAGPTPYPFKTCQISGETLGGMGEPITITQDGYEVKFCCQECVDTFTKHPTRTMETVKAADGTEFLPGG